MASNFTLKQAWLESEAAAGGRFTLTGGPADMRAQFAGLVEAILPLLPAPSENVDVTDGAVEEINYRLYKPKEVQGPLPTGVWYHGGGYVLGDLNTDDLICRLVAEHTRSVIVSVEYRLAPEHKWPTQLEDAWLAFRWVVKNAAAFGGDPNRIYTVGISAGAGLALAVAIRALNDATLKTSIKGIAALVPTTIHPASVPKEYSSIYKSYDEFAVGSPVIDGQSMASFYSAAGLDGNNAEAWALLHAQTHANFPPTYLVSCEVDPLRDDTTALLQALDRNGVKTKHDHYSGLPHSFWVNPAVPDGQEFVQNLISGVTWMISEM